MRLMAEMNAKRTYLASDDATWIEVLAQVRGQTVTVNLNDPELSEEAKQVLRHRAELSCRATLFNWFETVGEKLGCEPIEGTLEGPRWTGQEIVWHPDLTVDGEPVPYFETYWVDVVFWEQAYWPPAPVETGNPEPPSPRASDIRRGPST